MARGRSTGEMARGRSTGEMARGRHGRDGGGISKKGRRQKSQFPKSLQIMMFYTIIVQATKTGIKSGETRGRKQHRA